MNNISSILSGAGVKAYSTLKDFHKVCFYKDGKKTKYLEDFTDANFKMSNLSGSLSGAGGNACSALKDFHKVCFDKDGKKTKYLEDFTDAGFEIRHLSCVLCSSRTNIASVLKKFHKICFDNEGNPTKYLSDFTKPGIGFRPRDLCTILSQKANSLEEFHDFCFDSKGNPTKYLSDFIEVEFTPNLLSRVLHGVRTKVCSTLKDFHKVCFDKDGKKTKYLEDFNKAGFIMCDLSYILSMTGANAVSILKNFHTFCFHEKKEYLSHFLAEKVFFSLSKLSNKLLNGAGTDVCSIFKKLHDLCFNETGKKTKYFNSLIKKYDSNEICDILYEKIKKDPADSLNLQQRDIGGVICQGFEGMDLESIDYNIQLMMKTGLKIDGILDTVSVKKTICHNNQYLSILLIKGTSSDHAVVLCKKNDTISIIDPLGIKSEFSTSLEEIKKDFIASGVKSVNIIYSNLQQVNSGTCIDISLILIKNILDIIQNIKSTEDIIEIIKSIRLDMYNTLSATDQQIVSLANEEKLQDAYIYDHKYYNHENDIMTSLPIIGEIEHVF